MVVDKTIVRVMKLGTALKAFATVTLSDETGDAITIDGLKVMEKKDKTACFVSFPSVSFKNKEGSVEYKDTVFPINAGLRDKIAKAVLDAYNYKLGKGESTDVPSPKKDVTDYDDSDKLPF